jgi:prevent-host-death family protein
MQSVNTTELRNHLPKYLADVTNGDEILVTYHGKTIARILPVRDERLEAKKLLLQWRKTCAIGDVISPLDEDWEVQQ